MADAVSQGGGLPSIGYLDMEKIKRENLHYNHNPPVTSVINMPAPPLVSPSTLYSGPPPPYSYPSSATSSTVGGNRNGISGGQGDYMSPPEMRRTSGDEKETYSAQPKSLPPIKEALSGDQQTISINSLLSSTAPQQKPLHTSQSPTSPVSRSYLDSLPKGPPNSFSHYTPPSSRPPDTYERSARPNLPPSHSISNDNRFPSISSFPSINSFDAHNQSSRSIPSPSTYGRPGASPVQASKPTSPNRDITPHTSAALSDVPLGYSVNSCQPTTSYPPTPGMPSYRTPTLRQTPSWRGPAGHDERMEEVRKAMNKEPTPPKQAYGEHVKRHLDIFDLESSLNEIAEGSGRCLSFSRDYSTRAHQTQRSGPLPGSLPTLKECDEMIREQAKVADALARMRDVICKQQQELIERRNFDQQNFKASSNDGDDDTASYADKLDGAGGFAGADAKKRRGRAAPPGRCHSCNRAETPEWRRGPDGARTLCNACGLHYAKLTRKMGSKVSTGPSNLRPKESSPSSP